MSGKKAAVQSEAEGSTTVTVTWRGIDLTVARDVDDWPIEVTLALEEGKPASAIRTMLGDAQWRAVLRLQPKNRDLGELFDALMGETGNGSAGNS